MLVTLGHRPQTDSAAEAPLYPVVIKCISETDALKDTRVNELLDGISQKIATREHINLFTSRSALTLVPEEYNAPKLTLTPSMRKARAAEKRQKPMRFEDMGDFIWPMYLSFADLSYCDRRHRSIHI